MACRHKGTQARMGTAHMKNHTELKGRMGAGKVVSGQIKESLRFQ